MSNRNKFKHNCIIFDRIDNRYFIPYTIVISIKDVLTRYHVEFYFTKSCRIQITKIETTLK